MTTAWGDIWHTQDGDARRVLVQHAQYLGAQPGAASPRQLPGSDEPWPPLPHVFGGALPLCDLYEVLSWTFRPCAVQPVEVERKPVARNRQGRRRASRRRRRRPE